MKKAMIALFTFVFFTLASLWFPGKGYDDQYYILVSVSGALFGIFVAFSIYSATTRMSKIDELLKQDESYLQSLYKLSKVMGAQIQDKTRKLIDDYLISQLDYNLVDFHQTAPSFYALEDYLLKLTPTNNRQVATFQSIETVLTESAANRKTVESLVNQNLSMLEWISIGMLYALIAYFLLDLNTSSLLAPALLTGVLLTALSLLLILLHEIDKLRWQANKWIWQPMHDLFISLDLMPYYPEDVLKTGSASLPDGETVRIAHYHGAYPDLTHKKIEIVKNSTTYQA